MVWGLGFRVYGPFLRLSSADWNASQDMLRNATRHTKCLRRLQLKICEKHRQTPRNRSPLEVIPARTRPPCCPALRTNNPPMPLPKQGINYEVSLHSVT